MFVPRSPSGQYQQPCILTQPTSGGSLQIGKDAFPAGPLALQEGSDRSSPSFAGASLSSRQGPTQEGGWGCILGVFLRVWPRGRGWAPRARLALRLWAAEGDPGPHTLGPPPALSASLDPGSPCFMLCRGWGGPARGILPPKPEPISPPGGPGAGSLPH